MLVMFDGDAAARASDPAEVVELAAEGADVVGRMVRVGGGDERVGGGGGPCRVNHVDVALCHCSDSHDIRIKTRASCPTSASRE